MLRRASMVSIAALSAALLGANGAWAGAPKPTLPVLSNSPTGTIGTVTVTTHGPVMQIQTGTEAVTLANWQSFSIGAAGKVVVKQNDASSILINRVTGTAASQINGTLTANGQVFLINPNGITIGSTGVITANGFVASTVDVQPPTSANGLWQFASQSPTSKPQGVIVNGQINAPSGYVVLLGGSVTIGTGASLTAKDIAIGAGAAAQLSFPTSETGDLTFNVAAPVKKAAISIAGQITATNGEIILDAGTFADAVINVSGTVSADNSAVKITVGVDPTSPGLQIGDAMANLAASNAPSGQQASSTGSITFSGTPGNDALTINNVSYGLIWNTTDLTNINKNLGGNYALADDLDFSGATYNNDLIGKLESGGSFDFYTGIFNGLGHTLSNININANGASPFVGVFGGIETSGAIAAGVSNLNITSINIDATGGTLGLPLGTYNVGGLAGALGWSGKYGNATQMPFARNVLLTGTLTAAGASNIGGLAGYAGGSINHTAVSVTLNSSDSPDFVTESEVGGLVGKAGPSSSINDSAVYGTISTNNSVSNLGGLIGLDSGGNLDKGSFFGTVSSNFDGPIIWSNSSTVGSLIGENVGGFVENSSAKATVVLWGSNSIIGGLVGDQIGGEILLSNFSGTITASTVDIVGGAIGLLGGSSNGLTIPSKVASVSATAKITAGYNISFGGSVGGLVGLIMTSSTVTSSHAFGSITAGQSPLVGGIAGYSDGGIFNSSSSDTFDLPYLNAYSEVGTLIGWQNIHGSIKNSVYNYAGLNSGIPLVGVDDGTSVVFSKMSPPPSQPPATPPSSSNSPATKSGR